MTPGTGVEESRVAHWLQVSTTLPHEQAAELLAARVVEERLAACAQVLGPVSSTYFWKGKVERAREWYCHLKTTSARLMALQQRIRELHPYETPEVIAVPIVDGDPSYLKWIEETVDASATVREPRI
jgi:periplasmic divalent cation tolerance protein